MATTLHWESLEGGKKRERLRCTKCENPLLILIDEPMARKAKIKTAKRRRMVAECPMCKSVRVV